MNGVRKKEIRGFFFDSMPSEKHEDHYAMYLEIIKLQKTDFKSMQDQQGRCKMCPNWWFSSPTEVKRHRRFLHPDPSVTQLVENMMEQQPADQSEKLQYYRFQWKVENGKFHNLSFPTYHKLSKGEELMLLLSNSLYLMITRLSIISNKYFLFS